MAYPAHGHGRQIRRTPQGKAGQLSLAPRQTANAAQGPDLAGVQAAAMDPLHASPAQLLAIQRMYGNRAVQRMLDGAPPSPARELHASPRTVSRASLAGSRQGGALDSQSQAQIESSRGGGTPLDAGVGAQVGGALGADFSGVKVHTDTKADALNRSLSARAFTTGSDIFFSQGAYQPGSSSGKQLLAHELTHVVQQGSAKPNKPSPEQGRGVQTKRNSAAGAGANRAAKPNKLQFKLTVGAANDRYEQEADQVAAKVMAFPAQSQASSLHAKTFANGKEVALPDKSYQPGGQAGQASIAREFSISAARGGQVQRKFGFEIELPMLFTYKTDIEVPDAGGGADIGMNAVPVDAMMGGKATKLVDFPASHMYLNGDHSRTLDPLYRAELDKYADDHALDDNDTESLGNDRARLMPHGASIVEVVTTPWDENALSRPDALTRVRGVIGAVNGLYDSIDGNQQAALGDDYHIGSTADNADLFQPRLGYFHATYGVKLAQIPNIFKQTTSQKKKLAKYAAQNPAEQEHARNVALTQSSVGIAKKAMARIKKLWPKAQVKRKILWDTTKTDMSSDSEKDFLGFVTLLCNYFLLMKAQTSGGELAKKLVGMHYYKSDLYDVAQSLPAEIIDRLNTGDLTVTNGVIDAICESLGIDSSDELNGHLGGLKVHDYVLNIFTGHLGVIKADSKKQRDPSGKTFRDPVLANSINPYSNKLSPEMMGPDDNQSMGMVMENRHLEYTDPRYGELVTQSDTQMRDEAVQYGPPKAGDDDRTEDQKAMFDSIGARLEGPAKRPIAEWEGMMMKIFDMVKGANSRR